MASATFQDSFSEFRFFMRCTICLESFNIPRTLPCLHTFCTSCLQHHVDATLTTSTVGDAQFKCPTCREQITLPRDGVCAFRRDFRMEQVREILSRNQAEADDTNNDTCCSICTGSFDASSFSCKECRKSFCDMCMHIHGQIPVFSGHIVEEHNPVVPHHEAECTLHPNDYLSYICEDCVEPVCSTCVMKLHGDHVVVEASKGIQDILGHLDFQHKTLQVRQTQLVNMLCNITDRGSQLRTKRSVLIGQIKDKARKVVEQVYKQEKKLLQELEEHVKEEEALLTGTRNNMEKMVRQMTTTDDKAAEILSMDPGLTLIKQYHDMERDLTQLVENSMVFGQNNSCTQLTFEESLVTPRLGRISLDVVSMDPAVGQDGTDSGLVFSESLESASGSGSEPELNDSGIPTQEVPSPRDQGSGLGHLLMFGNHEMKISLVAKLGKYGSLGGEFSMPRDVCFMSDVNHFAVCDTNNERIQVFDTHGLLVNVIGQGRVRPWGVAYSSQGELLVSDNVDKCVKVYSRDGELLRRLGSFLCPCGIAVSNRNHVVVTDFFSTCAYVIDSTGDVRKQVRYRTSADKHACGASRVAVTSRGDIIISDVSNASLKAYNRHGRHLWTVFDFSELLSPQGICVTKDDVIIVGDSVHHRLALFNINGEFLGSMNVADGRVKEPTSLGISNSQMLVIGRMKANQVRVYKMISEQK